MRSRAFTIAIATAMVLTVSPVLAPPARAEPPSMSVSTILPVALWAATGAMIGAVVWPMIVGGAAAGAAVGAAGAAAPAAAGIMSASTLMNAGALAGAFIGGTGYLLTR
jgi:hypothetical protein